MGPGDRLFNLFFLALQSIVPYLLWLGAGLPHPLILTHRWTSALSEHPAASGSGQSLWGTLIQKFSMLPPGPETHPSRFLAHVLHIPLLESFCRTQFLLTGLVFFFVPEAVVIEVRGILNFLPRTVLYFSTHRVL